jgi:hypothetical protein
VDGRAKPGHDTMETAMLPFLYISANAGHARP